MASDIVLTNPDTMAQPGGHYTHAVTANGFVFIAGQLPIAPDGAKLAEALGLEGVDGAAVDAALRAAIRALK